MGSTHSKMESAAVQSLTAGLKSAAGDLGFGPVGVCPAATPAGISRFREWLAAGYAGEMQYLVDRSEAYAHPRHVLDGVQSIVMLALPYRTVEPGPAQPGRGRLSRYAWGDDYHDLIRQRLDTLCNFLHRQVPGASVRGVVDTAPMLEREFAQLAGLGWIGKNTLLLNKRAGSWFFLCALLTNAELEFDQPHESDHCGTCRACLDACPTQAFVDAYVLDPRRCISYLTIESRQPIPHNLRAGIGDWLFGCDICQEVCPWNREAPITDAPELQPRGDRELVAGLCPNLASHGTAGNLQPRESDAIDTTVDLCELFYLTDDQFRARFRHTPLWRPKRRGILRNAAIVLGNQLAAGAQLPQARAALTRGLNDEEPLVRGACAWALAQSRGDGSLAALRRRARVEDSGDVRAEIQKALGAARG